MTSPITSLIEAEREFRIAYERIRAKPQPIMQFIRCNPYQTKLVEKPVVELAA